MSIFHKHESYLGIDIGAHGIKMVELRQSKGRPQLWTYGIADASLPIHSTAGIDEPKAQIGYPSSMGAPMDKPLPRPEFDESTIDHYVSILKDLLAKSKAVSKRATVSLPVSSIFHAVMTLPKVPLKELQHHVLAKVKNMLPQPMESMQIVHQVVPPKDPAAAGDMKILVTAAPRDIVKFYTVMFARAGLALEALETEAFAVERSLMGHDRATAMIVDIGHRRSNFFIIDGGVPLTHRSLEIGGQNLNKQIEESLGLSAEDAVQAKSDFGRDMPKELFGMFAPLIDPIRKEIRYNLDLYTRQTGNENARPEKIILTGGASLFPPILALIAESFPLKVFIGDPWARVVYQQGLQPIINPIAPRMAVAIGLALRHFST